MQLSHVVVDYSKLANGNYFLTFVADIYHLGVIEEISKNHGSARGTMNPYYILRKPVNVENKLYPSISINTIDRSFRVQAGDRWCAGSKAEVMACLRGEGEVGKQYALLFESWNELTA